MNIIFKTLKIENFLSIKNIELQLSDTGYVLLNGVNLNPNDGAKSNGSGKSSIWDALCWALCGETVRGVSSNVVNINNKDLGCKVNLSFICDNNSYIVERTKDYKSEGSNLKIFINGEDKSGKGIRDSEKLLSQYLPELTKELICSVILLGQGLPHRFTNNTPSGRKEVLEKLSKSDFMIEDIKQKLSNRQDVLYNLKREKEDKILSLNSKKEITEKNLEDKKKELEHINNSYCDFDSLLEKNQEDFQEVDKELNNTSNLLDKINLELLSIREASNNINNKKNLEISNIEDRYRKEINKSEDSKRDLEYNISTLRTEINKLKSIKDICPTCGQKLPNIVKPDVSNQESELKLLEENLKSLQGVIDSLRASKEKEITNCNDSFILKEIELKRNLEDKEQSIRDLNKKLSEYKDTLKNLEQSKYKLISDKDIYYNNKNNIEKDISEYQSNILNMDTDILYYNNEKEDIDSRLSVVNKMMGFAKREFRGLLLTNIVSFINVKSKEYCKDIFDTELISFELVGNNLLISYDGKPYENLSGGEKQKVDIIIQFTLRDMLCQFSNFSSNLLVLDELFDNLDSIGCEKVVNLLATKLNDLQSIFIVTHHSDIPISSDSIITVFKDKDGMSYIK